MGLVAHVIPLLTILFLALVGVVPWGVPNEFRFFLTAAAYMAIHYWQHHHAGLVPPLFVALVGLAIDILTSGPLGFWPLVFLAGVTISRVVGRLAVPADGVQHWLGFVLATTVASCMAWIAASAYFVQPVDWRPMAVSAVVQASVYPLLTLLLGPLERLVAGPGVLNLDRRG